MANNQKEECIFCKIITGEIPCYKIYENKFCSLPSFKKEFTFYIIHGISYTWEWKKRSWWRKWSIDNITAHCPVCTAPYKFTIDPYNKVTANCCYCDFYGTNGTININSSWYSLNRSEQYMLILPADARTIIINKAKEYGYGG